ncbi:MAG: outer membrane lipoprotein-sorting protein [Proteobacteria bacterium]|nr:outer membrane lipoprotein-sorting protein [Pseudomonadota bacterium]MBU1058847.1 outer membrane lipoprotein-sorting protein [Pseudomonadota bacterium]
MGLFKKSCLGCHYLAFGNNTRQVLLLLVIGLFLVEPTSPAHGAEYSAREIMEMVDGRDDGDRSIADMQMVLFDQHNSQRLRSIRSFGIDQGEDRYNLMFFHSPADVKGTGFMTYDYEEEGKDDDQWLYLPALRKIKRIASSDKSGSFMGSDFSYSDLTKNRLNDYTYTFHKKQAEVSVYGKQCWVIESVPKNVKIIKETGYTRSILFVRQDNMMVVRAINYVKDGGDLKYFDVKKVKRIDDIWTALEIHMTRKKGVQTVHRTILTLTNVKYNQDSVDETLFTIRRLEKGL